MFSSFSMIKGHSSLLVLSNWIFCVQHKNKPLSCQLFFQSRLTRWIAVECYNALISDDCRHHLVFPMNWQSCPMSSMIWLNIDQGRQGEERERERKICLTYCQPSLSNTNEVDKPGYTKKPLLFWYCQEFRFGFSIELFKERTRTEKKRKRTDRIYI